MLQLFFVVGVVLEAIPQSDAQLCIVVIIFIRKVARRWTEQLESILQYLLSLVSEFQEGDLDRRHRGRYLFTLVAVG